MLNEVLSFFSEIIHNAWQWSHMTLTPPPGQAPARSRAGLQREPSPLAFESSQCTVAQYKYTQPPHTNTDSYFCAVQHVRDRGARSTVT